MSTKVRSVLKNSGIAFGILGIATAFCFLVQRISESDTHVPLLFVLAVLFVSRFTDGYVYGIVASIIAVFGVNYVFTFPYFKLNFAITGYPLTFVAMLAVACSVSALTTQIKKQEQMRLEVEREKMRANLLRAVSHDIRTPLTSIVGSASGIIDNYDALSKENILELLEDMKSEGQWLVRMVENLLSITRIGDGTARIHKEEELVEEVISGENALSEIPELAITDTDRKILSALEASSSVQAAIGEGDKVTINGLVPAEHADVQKILSEFLEEGQYQFSEVGTIAQFGEIGTLYYDIFDREEGIRIITEKLSTGDFRKTVAVYSGDPEEKLSVVIYENYEGTFQKIVRQRLWFYDLLQVPEGA